MRTRLSPKLIKLAHLMAKIPGVKFILKPLYYPYKERIAANRNNAYRHNGLKLLELFDEIMQKNNIRYSVFAGTLLGAVREKGFLKHDNDIDVCLWNEDYSENLYNVLTSAGFKRIRRFEVQNGVLAREETYCKDYVEIDLFYICSDDKFPTYQCDFSSVDCNLDFKGSMKKFGYVKTRRNEFPVSPTTQRVPFETITVNAITNAHEWLKSRYGEDYMVPNPDFSDRAPNPHMHFWPEARAIFYEN